jgi:molybdenum cofactor cytidylyltransferase
LSSIAGVVLAAGTSSRFGSANKLLADWHGQPMLRTVVEAALATDLDPLIVVTGHENAEVQAVLAGLDVIHAHNAGYASGQAGSLKTGISGVPEHCDGAMVLLGDMPRVCPGDINKLLDAFENEGSIVVPHYHGKRGNPVVIGRRHFARLAEIAGDKGARELLSGDNVVSVEMESDAVLKDFDTPESFS